MRHAMILAAGIGERMRPLTDNLPKPLLQAGGRPLLQYHLENLARAGVERIIINHARHGEMIEAKFGNGRSFGVEIIYSPEGEYPLETGGGIKKALPMLGQDPFIVVNADIWTDYDFNRLPTAPERLAHLVFVKNPDHHPQGDFTLLNGIVSEQGETRFTYSGIGVYRPELISACQEDRFPLVQVLRAAALDSEITGEFHSGQWVDVGTPERLSVLDQLLRGVDT